MRLFVLFSYQLSIFSSNLLAPKHNNLVQEIKEWEDKVPSNWSYKEPTDQQLIDEINFEIRSRYGGEINNSEEIYQLASNIFTLIAEANRIDTTQYTFHVLGSKYEANAFASPGDHIWITRAAIEGIYYQRVQVHERDGRIRIKEEPKESLWYSDIQSIPQTIAHELGHHENGDLNVSLNKYRANRREAILGEAKYRASWFDIYSQTLPGGRTYRQEVAADTFAVIGTEEAGFPTSNINKLRLEQGRTYESDHPADSSRGWKMGVQSSRVTDRESLSEPKMLLQKLKQYRYDPYVWDNIEIDTIPVNYEFENPWEAIDRIPNLYKNVFYQKKLAHLILPMQKAFQKSLLKILKSNPDIKTLLRLHRKLEEFYHGDRPLLKSPGQFNFPVDHPLNERTIYSDQISQQYEIIIKSLDPSFNEKVEFAPEKVLRESDYDGRMDPRDARDQLHRQSIEYHLTNAINTSILEKYKNNEISFKNFLEKNLVIGINVRKDSIKELLSLAKSPEDLAQGYHFIITLGSRYWGDTTETKPLKIKQYSNSWLGSSYVNGSMYEEIIRGLYDGEHLVLMKEKGWFDDCDSPEKLILKFLKLFAKDESPLYRRAEKWPSGDLAGIMRIFPEISTDPFYFKSLLDKAGKDFFKDKNKPKFRVSSIPFGIQFDKAKDAYHQFSKGFDWAVFFERHEKAGKTRKEIMELAKPIEERLKSQSGNTELTLLNLGTYTTQREGLLRSVDYSKEKAKRFYDAMNDSSEEQEALNDLLSELEENRAKCNETVRQSYILEHHFMEMHPVKSYYKRALLMKTVLKNASNKDLLPIFTITGELTPRYNVEDRYVYGDEEEYYNTEGFLTYTHYENQYEAALGRLYESVETLEDAQHMLKNFDFTKAPILKMKLEVTRYHFLKQNPFLHAANLNEALEIMNRNFSSDNPFRWTIFEELWERFNYQLQETDLNYLLTNLPDLQYFKKGEGNKNKVINYKMLNDFFEYLIPKELSSKLKDKYSYDLSRLMK
ncbi:hypothetical protein BVX93_01275, partial [bacterium B13(2017)]